MATNKSGSSFLCSKTSPSRSSTSSSPQSSFILVDANNRRLSDPGMASTGEVSEDVTSVMTEVLKRLDRIVEHFREKGENDAANNIAKNTVATVHIFNETIAPWDMATAMMRSRSQTIHTTSSNQMEEVADNSQQVMKYPPKAVATTWASIAAVAPAAGNKVIKFAPSDALQMKVKEVQPEAVVADADSEKKVVWIRGWPTEQSLSNITNRICQGPIYSMAYSEKDSAACIIFQHGYSARALYTDDQQHTKQYGHSRFGPGCDVVEGLPFPDNDDLRRMTPPFNERRRLTFARSQLFTRGLSEERFRSDIYSIVGAKNVELVWLFNTGNATVVLSAVPLARLVRNEFIRISKTPGSPYQGVIISYSHDPCERPMTLITQMQTGRQARAVATYGRTDASSAALSAKNGPPHRRVNSHDIDGWQTVVRRR